MRAEGVKMTIDEILIELERRFERVGWRLSENGIRRGEFGSIDYHCPLSALLTQMNKTHVDVSDFETFIQSLGLSRRDVFLFANAADYKRCDDKTLRAKLLLVCGLEEEK